MRVIFVTAGDCVKAWDAANKAVLPPFKIVCHFFCDTWANKTREKKMHRKKAKSSRLFGLISSPTPTSFLLPPKLAKFTCGCLNYQQHCNLRQ